MGVRDQGKVAFQKSKVRTKKLLDSAKAKTDRSPALQAMMERLGVAGKWTWEKFSEAQTAVENKMKQYMGFDKYRDELESSLEEALKVIATQEERIHLLEQRSAEQK